MNGDGRVVGLKRIESKGDRVRLVKTLLIVGMFNVEVGDESLVFDHIFEDNAPVVDSN